MPTGFQEPNYTQTPNDLFILMASMKEAELRVVLAICRLTFGFHRTKARASLTRLQKMTGLSRQGVINGAKAAEERGLITKISGKGVNEWIVNVVDQQLVNVLDHKSQRSRPPSIKQKYKQHNNNRNKESNYHPCTECGCLVEKHEELCGDCMELVNV